MSKPLLTLAILTGGALAFAQGAAESTYGGQSWLGLLVPASCEAVANSAKNVSAATREAELTVTDRTTTPAVDQSGTRGQSTALDPGANPPSGKGTMPQTGDVLSPGGASATDPAWKAARRQAASLGAGCKVATGTAQFALLLPGGSALRFDDLANQAIVKQMPSLPADSRNDRVFRVSVQGKLQNGKIALNSMRM